MNSVTIRLEKLPWVPLEERSLLPNRPAIYFAIDSLSTVQYIGASRSLRSRWLNHEKLYFFRRIPQLKIAWIPVDLPFKLLEKVERTLIYRFQPPMNNEKIPTCDQPAKQYWYRILKGHVDTLNFETLKKIEAALGVNFGVSFEGVEE